MKFHKTIDGYAATRKDGQVIRIEKTWEPESVEYTWKCTYENDFNGDNTSFAATKRELVANEQYIESLIK